VYEGMDFSASALEVGFQNGDVILEADGKPVDVFNNLDIYHVADARTVKVLRNYQDTVVIPLPEDFIFRVNKKEPFMSYRIPAIVDKVQGGTAASEAGLKTGDRIVAVGGFPTPSFTELTRELEKVAGRKVLLSIERGDSLIEVSATPSKAGKLGFELKYITEVYPIEREKHSFLGSFPAGWEIGTSTLTTYVSSLRHLFSADGVKSIGGFGAIGNLYPEKWNWLRFWEITAFLSVVLAFMNIIPIPGLDGGHAFFVLAEMITRRKPSEKFIEYAQYAGMMFLILLLLYANGADIVRAIMN
ncbi:MAG: site-2 protease family protein, partial [Paramuribaculum sp.]|nr:site-2 protease family protein [Paramuribaculum sp.]